MTGIVPVSAADEVFCEDKSDIPMRRICVRIGKYVFPQECILCGSPGAIIQTPVEYKAVLMLGFIGGGETTVVTFPLCETCAHRYLQARNRTNLIMTACYLVGFGILMLESLLMEMAPRAIKAVPTMLLEIAELSSVLLIVVAFVLLLLKNRNFPIKLKHRGWLFPDDKHHVFTFPDMKSMQRFIVANALPERGQMPPPPEHQAEFGRLSS